MPPRLGVAAPGSEASVPCEAQARVPAIFSASSSFEDPGERHQAPAGPPPQREDITLHLLTGQASHLLTLLSRPKIEEEPMNHDAQEVLQRVAMAAAPSLADPDVAETLHRLTVTGQLRLISDGKERTFELTPLGSKVLSCFQCREPQQPVSWILSPVTSDLF
jgi:hypothetical protein